MRVSAPGGPAEDCWLSNVCAIVRICERHFGHLIEVTRLARRRRRSRNNRQLNEPQRAKLASIKRIL